MQDINLPPDSILGKIYEYFKTRHHNDMSFEEIDEIVREGFWVQFGEDGLTELYNDYAIPYSDTDLPPEFEEWFDDYSRDTTYELCEELGILDEDGNLEIG